MENKTTEFRPLRRIRQAAGEDECKSLLANAPRGILSVHGENGYPYGIPVNYIFIDDKIYIHGAKEGHKMDAILSDDKVAFTVLSEPVKNPGEWWNCFTSVICFGRIKVIEDPALSDSLLRSLGAKYFPEGYDIDGDMVRNAPRAAVLEITIDHMSGKHVREK